MASSAFSRVAYNAELKLYYKEYLSRSPLETARGLLQGSRAARARKASEALRFAGFNALKSVYWGKLKGGREFDYTLEVPGECVHTWLRNTASSDEPEAAHMRRALAASLGVTVGRLHASGFIHGDLRPCNVIAHYADGRFSLSFLNNERTVRKTSPSGKLLLGNITQLNMLPHRLLGNTDRMRFFVAWRRQLREFTAVEAKIIAAEAYRRALQRQGIKS